MTAKTAVQIALFLFIAAFWYKFAWPMMSKEALAIGAIGGVLMHWAVTNKGNRDIVLIEPFTSGWRVLLYDMMLIAFITALLLHAGSVTAFLTTLQESAANFALLLALLGGIGIDYTEAG